MGHLFDDPTDRSHCTTPGHSDCVERPAPTLAEVCRALVQRFAAEADHCAIAADAHDANYARLGSIDPTGADTLSEREAFMGYASRRDAMRDAAASLANVLDVFGRIE